MEGGEQVVGGGGSRSPDLSVAFNAAVRGSCLQPICVAVLVVDVFYTKVVCNAAVLSGSNK